VLIGDLLDGVVQERKEFNEVKAEGSVNRHGVVKITRGSAGAILRHVGQRQLHPQELLHQLLRAFLLCAPDYAHGAVWIGVLQLFRVVLDSLLQLGAVARQHALQE